jgi:hypothetical protein
MRRFFALLSCAGLLAIPAVARAGICEDSFAKKGNFVTGLRFTGSQTVADLPPDVAISQLRGITARHGFQIIAVEPSVGSLLVEQSLQANARGFPIEFSATQENGLGTVRFEAKLPAGMNAKSEDAKTELCGMLGELKGGKAGKLAAVGGAKAVSQQVAPVALSAQEFSQQISKDAERNVSVIPLRYANKKFTLSGTVDYMRPDSGTYRVAFKILQPHEMVIRLPNMASTLAGISCMMGPGTSVFSLQLKPGKSIKLTGTFGEYSDVKDVAYLSNCVPAK